MLLLTTKLKPLGVNVDISFGLEEATSKKDTFAIFNV